MTALVLALAAFAFVGIFWSHRLDCRDREAELIERAFRLDMFPRRPGCRCRLCKEAATEYEAAL